MGYKTDLYFDIETFSGVSLKDSGAYKYAESIDFEILMLAWSVDRGEVKIYDFMSDTRNLPFIEKVPHDLLELLMDPEVTKHAHNAAFERICLRAVGIDIPIEQWRCTAVKSSYNGYPIGLAGVSKALLSVDKQKQKIGRALIKYFTVPLKPTKRSGPGVRKYPKDAPEKWAQFLDYCKQDVVAEMEIDILLDDIPEFEQSLYIMDQIINDRGVLVDLELAESAYEINEQRVRGILQKMRDLTGVDNPNSPAQLKTWLSEQLNVEIKSLAKENLEPLIESAGPGLVTDVVRLRQRTSKTSIKKYKSMVLCASDDDNRVRGLLQFYGASKTGRWAGRNVQLHNLPRNYIENIESVREDIKLGSFDYAETKYPDLATTLSQLIRTAFIAPKGKVFSIADFSAIEARVLSWVAQEEWRLEIFRTHGKIYEASASMMFNIPIESIEPGSEMRTRGKIAELALGYQGAVGAMKQMGGDRMGLSEEDMKKIVNKWRKANPKIVKLWADVDRAAITSIRNKGIKVYLKYLEFLCDDEKMTIQLPSGKKLYYPLARIGTNKWNRPSIKYKGLENQQWIWLETYGGKLVENIVQGIARDLLGVAMLALESEGFEIVMHVHDEALSEVDKDNADLSLKTMCNIMGRPVSWAPGLPLRADGFTTWFYKK